MLNNITKCTE